MFSATPTYNVTAYTTPSQIPQKVLCALHADPRKANIMLPHLDAASNRESSAPHIISSHDNLWVVCMTENSGGTSDHKVDFVLSCTEGPLGSYPIFIFTTLTSDTVPAYIRCRISKMALTLKSQVPVARAYSVFAPDFVADWFASEWTRHSGVQRDPIKDVYYHASLSYCDKNSLQKANSHHSLFGRTCVARKATIADLPRVSSLCYEFARESVPFTLSPEKATEEARMLIEKEQLWVYEIGTPGRQDIASIVASTRRSCGVAAITKVYTDPNWRRRGCAEALVRAVTEILLQDYKNVVLYVAHANDAASKVYRHVGFVGLDPHVAQVEGVESWKEIGFDNASVTLGHW